MTAAQQRLGLSPRQIETFDAIERFQLEQGRTPNYAELAQLLGLRSKSGICRLIDGLVERGYVIRLPNRAYSISIVDRDENKPAPLPPALQAQLDSYCRIHGDTPDAFIQTAVALHLDELERIQVGGGGGQ